MCKRYFFILKVLFQFINKSFRIVFRVCLQIHLAFRIKRLYNNNIKLKKGAIKMAAKIIRAISGILLILQCVVLIVFFGVLPLLGFSACPVNGSNADSIYSDGALAFVREVSVSDLSDGDVALYYKGRTAVGSHVTVNNAETSKITVKTKNGTADIPYAKIAGKGTEFSVPSLGKYADWLTSGRGLLFSVIAMGVMFVVFAVSAFMVRDKE